MMTKHVPKQAENPLTGEKYVQTNHEDWPGALAAWRLDRTKWQTRLKPALNRACLRGCWTLYNKARLAAIRRAMPCPMPWGHTMFTER